MDDSAETPAHSDDVSYTLLDDGLTLEVSLDEAWLNDPARVFPVMVDPTLVYANTNDTYVTEGTTADNSSSLALNVGKGFAGNRNRAFLKFNTSSFTGMNIQAATLNLWQSQSYGGCSGAPTEVYPVIGAYPWGTSAESWPGPETDLFDSYGTITSGLGYSSACPAGVASTDVTRLVREWADGSLDNAGISLRAQDETTTSQYKTFGSAQTYAPPSIDVTWSDPTLASAPAVPTELSPADGIATTTTPTLSARYVDPQGDAGKLTFLTYDVYTGAFLASYQTSTLSSNTVGSITLPALTRDVNVVWQVYATDTVHSARSAYAEGGELVFPTIRATSPAAGTIVSGTTALSASVAAGQTVTSLGFYIDGVLVGSDSTAPYGVSWNTSTSGFGAHDLEVRATGGSADGLASPFVALYIGDRAGGAEAGGSEAADVEAANQCGTSGYFCYWEDGGYSSQFRKFPSASSARDYHDRHWSDGDQGSINDEVSAVWNRSRVRWLVIWESPGYSGHRLCVGPQARIGDLQNFGTWGMNQNMQNRASSHRYRESAPGFAKCDLWADTSTDDP